MAFVSDLLLFLHLLAATAWLAGALWVAGDVKRTLSLGRPHLDALPARVRPALGLDAAAGIATVATGALLFVQERIGRPPIALTLGVLFALGRLGVLGALRRAWRDLARRIAAGEAVAAGDPAALRMAKLAGMAHGLWLLALAGMVFRE